MLSVQIHDPRQLNDVARQLYDFAAGCRFFTFNGDMGAGKTTLIKALCAALGVEDRVSSPTFSIVNEYESPLGPVYHFDFYRLKNIQEAYDMGYEEYFYSPAYCLVEWPEKIEELLPERYIAVQITIDSENGRTFHFSPIFP